MSKHHENALETATNDLHRAAQCPHCGDLEAQLDTALELLHKKVRRITDLQQRLEIAIHANQTLRVDNAALKLARLAPL